MKKCSPSLAIQEIQIKTTLRVHLNPVRIVIIKNHSTGASFLSVLVITEPNWE
jgi:hypothetical protein